MQIPCFIDLQKFSNKGTQLRNPPSPKLISENMSQSKTTIGSPKSPKSDDSQKFDSASSSPSKPGRLSSSIKSSSGNGTSFSLAERLAQSTKTKLSLSPKSPGTKSPSTSPNSSS